MLNYIIFIIVLLIIAIVLERWLKKKLKIDKSKWSFYKGVNPFQRWTEMAMIIAFLISIWFVDNPTSWLIGYFLISLSFRAFMEWKYKREEKEYILTLCSMFIYLFVLVIGFYLI
ncbi:DUF4181 domain-containing protein [Peribacillus simplex]|uniref:DUF4181 domain-containing protein n=1 Tax=Peribacillus simplex TaxID=1478 RepID=UPI0016266815|nr:DUF4181 domain-containing protein [Peribacillus simplex]